jgi:hypothetical protein
MAPHIVIDDSNYQQHLLHPKHGTKPGLKIRDWKKHPTNFQACATDVFPWPIIPESEWPARIAEQLANQSSAQDIRDVGNNGAPMPSYDQNGKGFCWAHSSTSAVTIVRAIAGEPYVPLSAFSVACMIKGFRDEGGFGAESLQFIADKGIPSAQQWPMQSMSKANDNPATWANALLHKCLKWVQCAQDAATRRMQVATASLLGLPVVVDYNWWSHSICLLRILSSTSTRIWNSWGDSWSNNGVGDLAGSKAWPDDAVIPYIEVASQT